MYPKNKVAASPDIEKEVVTADINGNVLPFKITAEVPSNIKATKGLQEYVISDTLSSGLYLTTSTLSAYYMNDTNQVDLEIDTDTTNDFLLTTTTVSDTDSRVTAFKLELTEAGFTKLAAALSNSEITGGVIYVTYDTVIDAGSDGVWDVKNGVKLEFTNSEGNSYTPDTDEETHVDFGGFEIFKFDGASSAALENVKFKVYTGTTTDATGATIVDTTTVLKDSSGSEIELTTDANGKVSYVGLKPGTYYIVETQAASANYKLLTGFITVTVVAGSTNKATVDVANYLDNGLTLPATGGMGTLLFVVVGASLILIAGVVFVVSKKRSNANK